MKFPRIKFDRRWAMLGIALVAGGAAAWLSQRHIQARLDMIDAQARTDTVAVLVAAADLPAGSVLTRDAVAVRDIPVPWASASALRPEQFDQVDAARLSHAVQRGEPILWAHVGAARASSLSERLAQGRRAVTIAVDEMSSVSGLIQPGDLIDLYVSFEHRGKRTTRPLLQSMKVLATGQQLESATSDSGASDPQRNFSTVTLDASPEQAMKLIAARDGGTMTAMLRRPDDARPAVAAPPRDLASLLGMDDKPLPPPKANGVAVIYGDRAPRSIPRLGEQLQPDAPEPLSGETLELSSPIAGPAFGAASSQNIGRVPGIPFTEQGQLLTPDGVSIRNPQASSAPANFSQGRQLSAQRTLPDVVFPSPRAVQ